MAAFFIKASHAAIRVVLALFLCHICAGVAYLQTVPAFINFQGRLTDNNNNPITGTHTFEFRICNHATNNCTNPPVKLWNETQDVTAINGVVAVQLGKNNTLDAGVFSGSDAYLQMNMGGEWFEPRERLITSPYAFNSQLLKGRQYEALVSTDAAQTITGVKTFTSSVTVTTDEFSVGGSAFVVRAGNIGIGTTNPGARLEVTSATGSNLQFDTSNPAYVSLKVGGIEMARMHK